MGGSPVAIGPFTGGLNLLEDPRVIKDEELAECTNLDVGRSGELTVRHGLKAVRTADNPINGSSTSSIKVINSAILGTGYSRLYARKFDVSSDEIYYSDDPGNPAINWTLVTNKPGQTSVVIQYVDSIATTVPFAWFIPRGGGGVGVRQNLNTNAVEDVPGMPRGSGAVIYRDRLFIYGALSEFGQGTYRVYYSAAGDFKNWPVNNFFDVSPGDGEVVTNIIIQGDNLIIFKRNSTWVLYFDSDPFLGTLRKVNNEVGCTGHYASTSYQNEIYVIGKRAIYRMYNLQFEEISKNLGIDNSRLGVDFTQFNDSISVIGSRIVAAVSTGGGIIPYRYYVYHTDSGIWSEYTYAEYPERFVLSLDSVHFDHQFATKRNSPNLYDIKPFSENLVDYGDSPNNVTPVSLATKKYSFSSPSIFKRLFWWSVETVGSGTIILTAVADDLRLSSEAIRISTVVRSVSKAFVTNRFRNIQFQLKSTSPSMRLIIFGMNINISEKTKVVADVTS